MSECVPVARAHAHRIDGALYVSYEISSYRSLDRELLGHIRSPNMTMCLVRLYFLNV